MTCRSTSYYVLLPGKDYQSQFNQTIKTNRHLSFKRFSLVIHRHTHTLTNTYIYDMHKKYTIVINRTRSSSYSRIAEKRLRYVRLGRKNSTTTRQGPDR